MKATFYTVIALIAFAANSLLCRMALTQGFIDPWNFTLIRLLSAALFLGLILFMQNYVFRSKSDITYKVSIDTGSWLSSLSLVAYALCFSIAYVHLDTGTGALILFSAVQLTMIGWGIYTREPISIIQWGALLIALLGFIYLMLPTATMPSWYSAILMTISGLAWGVYSILGKACKWPLQATTYNFMRSVVVMPFLLLVGWRYLSSVSIEGFLLASASGAIASGIGYSVWYVALPMIKSTQAAVIQLCVPVLAAIMGVVFLSEALTPSFLIASLVILSAVLVFNLDKVNTQSR